MNKKSEKSNLGWVGRVIRAMLIGFVIYCLLLLVSNNVAKNTLQKIEAYEAANQQSDDFKPWTGHPPLNEADLAIKAGYDWAETNSIHAHARCKEQLAGNLNALKRMGCSKYVTEQNVERVVKPIPVHKGWNDGTTTAQCIAETNAYWDVVLRDMQERGEGYAASVWARKTVAPLIRQCKNFDNIRISDVIHYPQLRLNDILKKARNGEAITKEDRLIVKKDYPGVFSFPDNPYRTQYLDSAEELFKLAGGRDYVLSTVDDLQKPASTAIPTLNNALLTCAEYQEKINGFKKADRENTNAQDKLRRSDGSISNAAAWESLNQAKIDNMNQWGLYTADAEAAGCVSVLK